MHGTNGSGWDGRVVVLPAGAGSPWLAGAADLRRALEEDPQVEVLVAWPSGPSGSPTPDGNEVARLVARVAPGTAVATPLPVVDALKRVDGDLVVATLDRDSLWRAVPPAAVHVEDVRRGLTDLGPDDHLRPLSGVARILRAPGDGDAPAGGPAGASAASTP